MSKYLNSSSSRYLKSQRIDASSSQPDTHSNTAPPARSTAAYTDEDERLFKALLPTTQTAVRTAQTKIKPRFSKQAPAAQAYTLADTELFDKLSPGQTRSSATPSAESTDTTRSGIRVIEFPD